MSKTLSLSMMVMFRFGGQEYVMNSSNITAEATDSSVDGSNHQMVDLLGDLLPFYGIRGHRVLARKTENQ
jgi:hypothetical protein